jgi:hypothetical protein
VDNRDAWLYHTLRREAEPLVMPNRFTHEWSLPEQPTEERD